MAELMMHIADLEAFLAREFPRASKRGAQIESLKPGEIRLRLKFDERQLRPGGTVSGPTLMGLADQAAYLLILSLIGPVALAVTTNLNINFLSKPGPSDILADANILKLGKRLAVTEVTMRSEGDPIVVAHATVTYSIPPDRSAPSE